MADTSASGGSAGTGSVKHALVTYNLLSERLCDTTSFTRYAADLVDPERRWERIEAKLRAQMADEAILMLQEVSIEWAARLAKLSGEFGYMPIWRCSGSAFGNYMGVALLVPMAKYEVRRVRLARVGDEINASLPPLERSRPEKASPSAIAKALATAGDAIGSVAWWVVPPALSVPVGAAWTSMLEAAGVRTPKVERTYTPRGDPWKESRTRHNSVVYACLVSRREPDARPLGVAVYHMPCRFRGKSRGVMTLHTWALVRLLRRWSGEDGAAPVLGGDFNFTPADRQYRMLASGRLLTDEEEGLPEGERVDDDPRGSLTGGHAPADPSAFDGRLPSGLSLTSGYAAVHGAEPEFTNYNHADMVGPEPFKGALDFVWLGEGLRPVAAPRLPSLAEAEAEAGAVPYPSEAEPSDHVAVRVDVEIAP